MKTSEVPALETEARHLRLDLDRMVEALAKADSKPEVVMDAISKRQERLSALEARIRTAKAAPEAIGLEVRRMEAEAKQRISDLQDMLGRNQEETRAFIHTLLVDSKLVCTPMETNEGRRFQIEGTAVLGKLLCSEFSESASPTGFETLLTGLGAETAARSFRPVSLVA